MGTSLLETSLPLREARGHRDQKYPHHEQGPRMQDMVVMDKNNREV